MRREWSAGGVVVRRFRGAWEVVVIRPRGRRHTWALPKGHVDPGETAEQAAVREVREETGLRTGLDEELGELAYWFRIDGERVHKTVTFFLLRWQSGSPMPQRTEVDEATWMPLEEAAQELTYPGERALAVRAAEILAERGVESSR